MNNLVQEIRKFQKLKRLNDTEFCWLIGQSPSVWSRVKHGERPPSLKFLTSVMVTFPELLLAVVDFMEDKGNEKS